MTIAESLDGKPLEAYAGPIKYDPKTRLYTFEDGSTAIVLTKMRACAPYVTASLSTMSVERYRVWKMK
jgi:hypothetical protein